MGEPANPADRLFHDLKERARELNCLYQIEELLNRTKSPLPEVFLEIIRILPTGYQFPDACQARIIYEENVYELPGHIPSKRSQEAPIVLEDRVIGHIEVSYKSEVAFGESGYFLKEEKKLIDTIAERIGRTVSHTRLKQASHDWENAQKQLSAKNKKEWMVIVDLLRRTDQNLYIHLSRKMIYYLFWNGIAEAKQLLQNISKEETGKADINEDYNRPSQRVFQTHILKNSEETFKIAARHLTDSEILARLRKWIQEEKAKFLSRAINNIDTPLIEVINAITHYHYISGGNYELSTPTEKGLRVSLIRRFFSDHLDYINIAKQYIEVRHYHDLVQRIIYPENGYGRLGGKSAGLFLALKILNDQSAQFPILADLRFPKTWYVAADTLTHFLNYNNLEEIVEQKYKEIDQIRLEYPNVIQLLKNSSFPPEIIKGLSMALDDFGDAPLIVRSSSLLEDRTGSAFSGKYKSLFLANQGSKKERLEALTDAIAEVYASIFGPDPIEYRAERGLLDFYEEMGILIQEVVGRKIGHYFFPAYAGVAFSHNEFRWSSRIRREDGLVRIVVGLGTRAVDRVSDDYPILAAPGKPNLRVNVTAEETIRYSPKKIDVIDLEKRTFETVEIQSMLREFGSNFPNPQLFLSRYEGDLISSVTPANLDFNKNDLIVTCEGLITRTSFMKKIQTILQVLQEKMNTPVDIEFASDGDHFYLLQCRPQSSSQGTDVAFIPKDIPAENILFTANRYISNGRIPDITHIVYVDPEPYNKLSELQDLVAVGRAIGKLNKLLPKRQFILLGPGRWGSRGDIKLGVQVTYSDFNNTVALVEIARKKGNYLPELSFGTHFFQDLVESSIRYIPLYPDDPGILFNQAFLTSAPNVISDILPEFAHLQEAVRVIDVPRVTNGKVLRVLMNADMGEAIGYFTMPIPAPDAIREKKDHIESPGEDSWRWRLRMAERIASAVDPNRFGVKAIYVFGSTKNATAGPGSDIDLLVHFQGTPEQRHELLSWLEGWSLCLGEVNHSRTGQPAQGLLDVHLVTDEDIAQKTSYAVKIGAVTDAARPLSLLNPRIEEPSIPPRGTDMV